MLLSRFRKSGQVDGSEVVAKLRAKGGVGNVVVYEVEQGTEDSEGRADAS